MSQISCANPLYLGWLREWWDAANAHNAKDRLSYKKAWESMKAHPIAFSHPSEAIQLTGIGPRLVERLTERLETHCRDEGIPMPVRPTKKRGRGKAGADGAEGEDSDPMPKKSRKAPKGYVPKPDTGAYALILTLAELPEGETVGLSKTELIDQAQPLCSASFSVPSHASGFHTAWNNMATLEKKLLVYNFGRPLRRYALTEEGWALAKSMKETMQPGSVNLLSNANHSTSSTIRQSPKATSSNANDDGDEHLVCGAGDDDDFDDRVKRKFGSRAEFMRATREGLFQGGLDPEALALIGEFAQRAAKNVRTNPSLASRSVSTDIRPSAPRTAAKSMSPSLNPAAASGSTPSAASSLEISDVIPNYQPIVVPPGSFTVELVLDTREVRSKTDRNYIQEQLKQMGLRCEQRALQVGDMLWTAKINDQSIISKLPVSDRHMPEIVLDYVVERKRLDDLDASIKDRRFLEQKFRLKRSGIENAIYIIEDYGSLSSMEDQQHTRMMSAIAATQVIDGFFVKRTRKLDETITYLANMTRLLKERYEKKPIHLIPSHILTTKNHFHLRAPKSDSGDHHYITYEALAALASKSATLTLRDIFLKMLMCSRGITGDKAIEIQKTWPTPRNFVEAFEGLPTAAQKHDLLFKAAGNLQGRRKIGKAVSHTVAEIWGSG